jgi:uncharacterized SAM-binding protein YcdF (DUF218 family)
MYFALSKTLGFFVVPTNLIAGLALLGLALMILRRPAGKLISILALGAFLIAGLSPLGNMLLTPLEQRFPGMQFPDRVDGIIVLGGSYDTQIRSYLSTIVLGEDTEPMALIASLAHRYPEAKIIFSGGSEARTLGPSEAAIARQFFISFGVDPDRILVEDRSRNTEENAQFTSRVIQPAPGSVWLLVTSAYHMPRAAGTFRKTGFNVIGFPAGWRTHGWRDFNWPEKTVTENLRRVDIATREWLGLTIYKLFGYSNAWFPGQDGTS